MRLIDADALMHDIEKYHLSNGKFQHWIEVQPTIDAVSVVRCKDCKHYDVETVFKEHGYGFCPMLATFRRLEGFCDLAERKEDETDI